jgi:hypothetical protein
MPYNEPYVKSYNMPYNKPYNKPYDMAAAMKKLSGVCYKLRRPGQRGRHGVSNIRCSILYAYYKPYNTAAAMKQLSDLCYMLGDEEEGMVCVTSHVEYRLWSIVSTDITTMLYYSVSVFLAEPYPIRLPASRN